MHTDFFWGKYIENVYFYGRGDKRMNIDMWWMELAQVYSSWHISVLVMLNLSGLPSQCSPPRSIFASFLPILVEFVRWSRWKGIRHVFPSEASLKIVNFSRRVNMFPTLTHSALPSNPYLSFSNTINVWLGRNRDEITLWAHSNTEGCCWIYTSQCLCAFYLPISMSFLSLAKIFHFLFIIYFWSSCISWWIYFPPINIYCWYISNVDTRTSVFLPCKYTVHLKGF